jgi:transcriptional regulator GlxA family with amidase domain
MNSPPTQRIIRTAILALKGFASIPVISPMFLLDASCGIWRSVNGGSPRGTTFKVDLVSLTKTPLRFADGVTIHPTASIGSAVRPDLIFIPAIGDNFLVEDFARTIEPHRSFIPWIQACAADGARVVSACTGAFLLAETGLLDGRHATTHWLWADEFHKRYPKVTLDPERLIVDEGNIITSGAATSFNDLVLYLIELYCGYEAAVLSSKLLAIDMRRRTQLPYTMFSSLKTHNDRHILQIQHVIESENHRNWTSKSLAKRAGMSLRNFDRRFQSATGEAPSVYIQKMRIEKAKRELETTNDTVEEIAEKIGYKDSRSFRRLFYKYTALSPKSYRMKYGAPAATDSRRSKSLIQSARATPADAAKAQQEIA